MSVNDQSGENSKTHTQQALRSIGWVDCGVRNNVYWRRSWGGAVHDLVSIVDCRTSDWDDGFYGGRCDTDGKCSKRRES